MMYTTTDEQGMLNNYASEPEMYYSSYPSFDQQRNYLKWATVALLLVTSLVLTTLAVS